MEKKIRKALNLLFESCDCRLSAFVQKWHDHLTYERHASAHTIYNYVLDIRNFLEFLSRHMGQTPNLQMLEGLKLSTFRSFLANRVQSAFTATSNKRALSAIKNFYAYLEKNAGIHNIQLKELTSPKSEKSLPRPVTHNQIQSLMDLSQFYVNQPKWIQLRDEAFYLLLYGCGLRINEALSLDLKHLNAQTLKVLGKRNKERIVPMLLPVYTRILSYLAARPGVTEPDSPLFIGTKGDRLHARVIQKHMEKVRLYLGLPETVTPHSLRHSYASHLLAGGADLRSIQELMGHDSLSSTQVYTKLEDQDLFDTLLKAHPRSKK